MLPPPRGVAPTPAPARCTLSHFHDGDFWRALTTDDEKTGAKGLDLDARVLDENEAIVAVVHNVLRLDRVHCVLKERNFGAATIRDDNVELLPRQVGEALVNVQGHHGALGPSESLRRDLGEGHGVLHGSEDNEALVPEWLVVIVQRAFELTETEAELTCPAIYGHLPIMEERGGRRNSV